MPRDNLLNSACLELFEFIKRENLKTLIVHLVETYREKLQTITYVDTFQNLILRYDQLHEPPTTQELDQSFTSHESDTPARNGAVNGGRWGNGLKDPDQEEDSYFNGSDPDDDEDELARAVKPITNGASPVRPLVNYPDDDADDDMDILTSSVSSSPAKKAQSTDQDEDTTSPTARDQTPQPSSPVVGPPERLSEKRRREEDEEDELAKIATQSSKRRSSFSSTSSATSTGPTHGHMLRRKKSLNSGKDGGPPKKMAISIGLKSSGGEGAAGDNE
jgi:protein phosphatase-4 regulatory subunit 3